MRIVLRRNALITVPTYDGADVIIHRYKPGEIRNEGNHYELDLISDASKRRLAEILNADGWMTVVVYDPDLSTDAVQHIYSRAYILGEHP